MWSLWIFFILSIHFNEHHFKCKNIIIYKMFNIIKYLPKLHKCIATPSLRKSFSKILLYFAVVSLRPNTLYFISLIFKSSCHMSSTTFGQWEVRQIFSTKANLVFIFASVFILFYLLLHYVRAYKMHAYRMLHFKMSDCMMMYCLIY